MKPLQSPDADTTISRGSGCARSVGMIHRPFFTAAVVIALTFGASWGAWLLWTIGRAAGFTAVDIHQVNAHGEAQIFGWVGLFIMGFAYQAFPSLWKTRLAGGRLVPLVFTLMVVGLIVRTIGMSLHGVWDYGRAAAILGAAMECIAVWMFSSQIFATFEKSRRPYEPYIGFILTSLAWFCLSSAFSLWHTWATMGAATRDDLLFLVSSYQGALRDAQIHGFALLMILGVSIRMLPELFRLPRISARRAMVGLAMTSLAVAAEVSLFVAYRWTDSHALAAALYGSWILLAAGIVAIAWPWMTFWVREAVHQIDPSAKFVPTACLWLAVSMLMLLLFPVYQLVSRLPFSHAYYGAIRHAITVGFISMMILGLGSAIVARLYGVQSQRRSALWGPFILLNLGCLLRVTMQPLTDFLPGMFSFVGVSGTLEVAALAWWAFGLLGTMWNRGQAAKPVSGDSIRQPVPQLAMVPQARSTRIVLSTSSQPVTCTCCAAPHNRTKVDAAPE